MLLPGSVGIPVCLALRKKRQAGMPVLSGLKIRPEPDPSGAVDSPALF